MKKVFSFNLLKWTYMEESVKYQGKINLLKYCTIELDLRYINSFCKKNNNTARRNRNKNHCDKRRNCSFRALPSIVK